ncbi:tol-pal system protein YbgF [Balneatrix alpica]|uniref:tol-pal system protein YbgF n=1 Tax=Balneatrix alpica TaxID=75684 RepID=UPI00273958FE|nr:tol-pal system protein YbgF [Balneatrix alpica]
MRNKPLITCFSLFAALGAPLAQANSVPVIEVQPVDSNTQVLAPAYGGNVQVIGQGGGRADPGLYEQLQALQREVQVLRGMVEQQSYQIEQLKTDQRDRYMDLDRRLSQVSSGANSSAASADTGSSPSAASSAAPAASGSEQEAYMAAFELVRQRSFDQAAQAYEAFLQTYPNGALAGNAYYWLGEIYLAVSPPKADRSRDAFKQVVERFSDHRKVPDALYKLGQLSDRQGDKAAARKYLEQVVKQHPDSAAAKLASDYLKTLR